MRVLIVGLKGLEGFEEFEGFKGFERFEGLQGLEGFEGFEGLNGFERFEEFELSVDLNWTAATWMHIDTCFTDAYVVALKTYAWSLVFLDFFDFRGSIDYIKAMCLWMHIICMKICCLYRAHSFLLLLFSPLLCTYTET